MNKKFFTANRKALAKALPDNALCVLFAGSPAFNRGDELFPFAPQRNFYYATGIDAPNVVFTLYKAKDGKISEKLYIERFDEVAAKWVGKPLSADEAKKLSGVEATGFVDDFEGVCAAALFANAPTLYLDLENRSLSAPPTEDVRFAAKIRDRYPALTLADAHPIFAKLRQIKTDDEVELITEAINVTERGIEAMMRASMRRDKRSNLKENELEAYFDFELKKAGAGHAFHSIIAGGANAATLHYNRNDAPVDPSALVLCDVGAQIGWYSADITRTFPVSGTFTDRQKTLYDIVLEAHDRVIEAVKAGAEFKSLNQTVLDFYSKSLKKIGLIADKSELGKYYYHGVSHPLGLETHDTGRGTFDTLKAGMVLTVEPGLYVAEEGIGIRIEDDVLVTEKGATVLSASVIRTTAQIEEFMKNA